MQGFRIEFNQEKNLLLKETRQISFEEIIHAIEKGDILADLKHHDRVKYPHQRILVVKIKNYAWVVPYVIDKQRKVLFFKTAYPSRVLTKQYLEK